ncbi:uncharacterized protein LOC107747843 [Sinocyclocheilus rhinocerous]|uniref:uncharacterized protein LOC107747843 n=1 Tax=Sinocyclocheilus rhinocerous TaxID=307959 RepID=UPI0007B80AAD|nr:PREDICTED: uncharacterized protein LOC107747843 [Sinocyclocheilus rhinocerous]
MQLCPQSAAAWRGSPRLPSRACKFSSALTAKAYSAAGQAASALHAMALLQVHQAKALKQLHEGGADPGVLQELCTATDLALRAMKVIPGSDDVHIGGPGAPPMADLGEYEGGRQASLPGLPDLPGRPIRRSGGGLCPTVLRRTEADGGVSTHPAPAVCCCLHPTAGCSPSVCSSPRAPSCGLHLRSGAATTAAFTTAAAWSWPQETGARTGTATTAAFTTAAAWSWQQETGADGNSPRCRGFSFLGMELDSVNLSACLSVEHAQSMLNCLGSW